jgi:tetratricopeptide (TPR) repeat protein
MTKKSTSATLFALFILPLLAIGQDEDGSSEDFVDPTEQSVPVADETVVQGPEPEAIAGDEEQLVEEFARYRQMVQEGSLDEADIAAKRVVELALKIYGPRSRETANALNNLGIVQHSIGQFDAAIQNFSAAVEIIEAVEDRLNDALINPLKGLGSAQLSNGRPDLARSTYMRAAHISQVNEGPHNLDQVEILELIAEAYIRLGDTKEARKMLDRIHIINVKQFEKNPLGLLPSLMSRADWQHRAGYYSEERASYRRAIRIIETSTDKNNPMLIEPLIRLGKSFYFIDVSMSTPQQTGLIVTGETYLKRATRIAGKAESMPWREQASTQVALADYYVFIESQSRARKIYLNVWDSLSVDAEHIEQREDWFTDPVAVRTDDLPISAGKNGDSPRDDILSGKIVVEYSVSSRGRVRDLRTEAFPPEYTDIQQMVHREIRGRVHRPRLEGGVPVDAENLIYEHPFSYAKADLDEMRRDIAEANND